MHTDVRTHTSITNSSYTMTPPSGIRGKFRCDPGWMGRFCNIGSAMDAGGLVYCASQMCSVIIGDFPLTATGCRCVLVHDRFLPSTIFANYDFPCALDVNECLENNGGCHNKRKCTNTPGSMKCSDCPPGWTNDGAKGCKGLCRLLSAFSR